MLRPLRNNHIQSKIIKSNQGFTVIEILIALVLIIIVLGLALSDPFSTTKNLDQQSDELERAVRFMSDEATLRNAVVRLHILLDKEPQEFAVEYGPSDSFILPPEPEFETVTVSKEEEERANKLIKETNQKFNKVQEFQESNSEVQDGVKILGIGNSNSEKFKTSGDVSIYAFPTGEKDDALIVLGNEETIIALEIDPFQQKINKKIHKIETNSNRELGERQGQKAKEIFETWLKDK